MLFTLISSLPVIVKVSLMASIQTLNTGHVLWLAPYENVKDNLTEATYELMYFVSFGLL